jgi:hypothetical protein
MENLTLIQSEKIEAIQQELQEIKKLILKKNQEDISNQWLSKHEVAISV